MMDFPQIDFPAILTRRIRISRALDRPHRRDNLRFARRPGERWLLDAYQEAPFTSLAIIFSLSGSGRLDVWMNPNMKPSVKDPDSLHFELFINLTRYLEGLKRDDVEFDLLPNVETYISAAVYGYTNGVRLLSLDSQGRSPLIPDDLRSEVERQTPFAAELCEMTDRYNFCGIYGPTRGDRWFDGRKSQLTQRKFMVVAPPLLDEIRQDRYLRLVAIRHHLTVNEYLRFRCMALSAHNAKMSCNYETLIKEVRS